MRNPLTFEAFVTWLDSKPKDETYDFGACQDCAIAQYVKEIGVKDFRKAGSMGWHDVAGDYHRLLPCPHIVGGGPWTFGAAAKRAKAYIDA